MSSLEENFTKFRYEDWLPLSNEDIYQLNEKDFQVINDLQEKFKDCLLYTSPSPRDAHESRMPSSA